VNFNSLQARAGKGSILDLQTNFFYLKTKINPLTAKKSPEDAHCFQITLDLRYKERNKYFKQLVWNT
jgi:hypothetical protein